MLTKTHKEYTFFLQELYRDDVWKMLVCCVFLNRTTRRQVDGVRDEFFKLFQGAADFLKSDKQHVAELIKPLGLVNKRLDMLVSVSMSYIMGSSVSSMVGVGKYTLDSYKIMFTDENVEPDDRALKQLLQQRELGFVMAKVYRAVAGEKLLVEIDKTSTKFDNAKSLRFFYRDYDTDETILQNTSCTVKDRIIVAEIEKKEGKVYDYFWSLVEGDFVKLRPCAVGEVRK